MSKKRFSVGQEVVRVRRGAYPDSETKFSTFVVEKIGTKYVYAKDVASRWGGERFDAKSGKGVVYRDREINRLYESREAFELAELQEVERNDFYRRVTSYSFRHDLELIPIEDVRGAAKLLGIELEKAQ
jgi:hypothetical protein